MKRYLKRYTTLVTQEEANQEQKREFYDQEHLLHIDRSGEGENQTSEDISIAILRYSDTQIKNLTNNQKITSRISRLFKKSSVENELTNLIGSYPYATLNITYLSFIGTEDEMLIMHPKEWVKAVESTVGVSEPETNDRSLYIYNSKIDIETKVRWLKLLELSLPNTVTSLTIDGYDFRPRNVEELGMIINALHDLLINNQNITHFGLSNSCLGQVPELMQEIMVNILPHTNITSLNLGNNGIQPENSIALGLLNQTKVIHVNLEGNPCAESWADVLADILEANRQKQEEGKKSEGGEVPLSSFIPTSRASLRDQSNSQLHGR